MNFADRQNRIADYSTMSTNAAVWSEDAEIRATWRRNDAYAVEDERPVARLWYLALARYHEAEAATWAYLARAYADDIDRHRAARDGREPNPHTFLQQRPPGSSMAWGELLRAYLLTTLLVALVFALLAAVGVVGGVGVALLWTPSQVAIMAGLWWSAREPGERRTG